MKGHIKKDCQKRAKHRLKIILGQVKGLEKMVQDEVYCVDVLNQSLAVQESLKSFDALMLENHLKTHVVAQLAGKNREQGISEILKLYKFRNK